MGLHMLSFEPWRVVVPYLTRSWRGYANNAGFPEQYLLQTFLHPVMNCSVI